MCATSCIRLMYISHLRMLKLSADSTSIPVFFCRLGRQLELASPDQGASLFLVRRALERPQRTLSALSRRHRSEAGSSKFSQGRIVFLLCSKQSQGRRLGSALNRTDSVRLTTKFKEPAKGRSVFLSWRGVRGRLCDVLPLPSGDGGRDVRSVKIGIP